MRYLSGVLWGGAFVGWIRYLTKWKVHLSQWTEYKLTYFLFYFFRHYSSSLLVVMSLEKFFALYFPFKSKTVCTLKIAKWVTAALVLIFIVYDVQYLIFYNFVKGNGDVNCFFSNKNHLTILRRIDSILYSFGTFTIMLLTNCAIVAKFMKAKCENILQNSAESTSQALNKYATKGTAMVVTVSVTFIILTAPVSVDQIMGKKLTPYPLYYVFMISMQYLSHSINGVLYCIVGTKFREEMIKIVKCHRKMSDVNYQVSSVGVSTVTI